MSRKNNKNDPNHVWAAIEPNVSSENESYVSEDLDQTTQHDLSDVSTDHPRTTEHLTLARSLIEKKYHPVMIFGTQASGKSSMLASLFHYLQNDPRSEAICMLGEWILPIETIEGKTVADAVSRFFNRAVMNFNNGEAVPRTQTDTVPFFIPVVLRPNNGKPDIRIAFLESSGENYQINANSASYFPSLKAEVTDVYRNFPGSLSILVVAPYTLKDAYTDQEIEQPDDESFHPVDQALYGALQTYQQERRWRDMDNYMFVLTKWDVYTGGISNPEFTNPPNGLVEKVISERYRLSWNFYRSMPRGGTSNSMQYSAGLISGDGVLQVTDKRHKQAINLFPRALWNWLYKNASGGTALNGPLNIEKKSSGLTSWLKKVLS
jgi:hypothetical protein